MLIYMFLNSLGMYLAFQNWWTSESASPAPIFILLLYAGICWIGILFLSIMISQLIMLKQDKKSFISLFSLFSKNDYDDHFGANAKAMNRSVQITSFGILIFSIIIFSSAMQLVKNYQLKKYELLEYAKIQYISTDVKGNEYSYIEYNNRKSSSTILTKSYSNNKKQINSGDSIKIIYSSQNPEIVELYSNFKNK